MSKYSTALRLLCALVAFVFFRYLYSQHYINMYVYITAILAIMAIYGYVSVKLSKK